MAQVSNFVSLRECKGTCRECIAKNYCLPQFLSHAPLHKFEALIKHKVLHKGDRLFQQGEAFKSLYVVHSGSFKAYLLSDDGEQQITGFHFQGELLGLDGLQRGEQIYGADALETSSVCELPYHLFEPLMVEITELRKEFIRYASRELAREKNRMLVLGKMQAERKLAQFLLDIAETMNDKKKSYDDFTLPMTRQDIANYLSLAVETVSRVLTRFQNAGLVKIKHRRIFIVNRSRLAMLASSNRNNLSLDKIA